MRNAVARVVGWACLVCLIGCGKGEVQVRAGDPMDGFTEDKEPPRPSEVAESPAVKRISVWLEDRSWDFRPWVEDFERRLAAAWKTPEAPREGPVSGWTEMAVTVDREGAVTSVEVGQHEGPPSLHEASEAAAGAVGGLLPLPADFAGDFLAMTVRLNYPAPTE